MTTVKIIVSLPRRKSKHFVYDWAAGWVFVGRVVLAKSLASSVVEVAGVVFDAFAETAEALTWETARNK